MRKTKYAAMTLGILMTVILMSCQSSPGPTTTAQSTPVQTTTTKPTTPQTSTTQITTTPQSKPTIPTQTIAPGADTVTLQLKTLEGKAVTKTALKPKYGGTISIISAHNPKSFEMFQQLPSNGSYLQSFVYDNLLMGDWARGLAGTGEYNNFNRDTPQQFIIGCLAESWEEPDALTYIFHMKKGIHFQNIPPTNGREVTADDVVYSIDYSNKHPWGNADLRKYLVSVKAKDKYAVEVKLNEKTISTLAFTAYASAYNYIFPHEIVDKYGDTANWQTAAGTGPFIISDFVVDSQALFKRNPFYWGKDRLFPENQLPYADYVKVLTILDSSTQVASLRTGKVDILATQDPDISASIKKSNPNLLYIDNPRPTAWPWINWRLDKAPYSNIKVRQAMSWSINRKEIISSLFKGNGLIKSWPVCASFLDSYIPLEKCPPEVQEYYDYNVDKAKKTLAEAGYPVGFSQELVINNLSYMSERMEIIIAYWEKIGIKTTLRIVEPSVLTSELYPPLKYPNMGAGISGQGSAAGPLSYMQSTHRTNKNGQNDPVYDKMYEATTKEFDPVKRAGMIADLEMYYLKNYYGLAFPCDFVSSFWQPWLKNHNGEQMLGQFYFVGAVWSYAWVDQPTKTKLIGK